MDMLFTSTYKPEQIDKHNSGIKLRLNIPLTTIPYHSYITSIPHADGILIKTVSV